MAQHGRWEAFRENGRRYNVLYHALTGRSKNRVTAV